MAHAGHLKNTSSCELLGDTLHQTAVSQHTHFFNVSTSYHHMIHACIHAHIQCITYACVHVCIISFFSIRDLTIAGMPSNTNPLPLPINV